MRPTDPFRSLFVSLSTSYIERRHSKVYVCMLLDNGSCSTNEQTANDKPALAKKKKKKKEEKEKRTGLLRIRGRIVLLSKNAVHRLVQFYVCERRGSTRVISKFVIYKRESFDRVAVGFNTHVQLTGQQRSVRFCTCLCKHTQVEIQSDRILYILYSVSSTYVRK